MAFLLTDLKDKYIALRGFHTNRRLIVIESDDWGSIRMPSRDVFAKLQRMGDHPERDGFLSNDSQYFNFIFNPTSGYHVLFFSC